MITRTFNAIHKDFYDEFEQWRKIMKDKDISMNGVYTLYANRKVCRLLKSDKKGILYIGEGAILATNNRIGKFVNSLNNTEKRHDGGNRFNIPAIQEKYPLKDMSIEIILIDNPKQLESKLLYKYYCEYGELPLFNRRFEN